MRRTQSCKTGSDMRVFALSCQRLTLRAFKLCQNRFSATRRAGANATARAGAGRILRRDATPEVRRGRSSSAPLVTAIMTAKQSIRKAQQQQATANDAFMKANAAVDEAERNADAAAATPQTADDRQHASDLRQVTSDRRQDVSNTRQQISDANLGGHFKTAHPWAVQNRTLGLVMCRRVWLLGRRALPGPGG